MHSKSIKTIRYRGKNEAVLETLRVQGRRYFVLERMSRRGAFRVFDPHAGPGGDYRILYKIPTDLMTRQRLEVLRRISGANANRNFPRLVDFTYQKQEVVVVFEWVWGTNLHQFFQAIRGGQTAPPNACQVARLFRGLAHGLSQYHRRSNLVHGDISPANIILTQPTTQLVLVDFGSAWPVECSAVKESGDGVTPIYAAPERCFQSASEDFRSDVFSLALVAYEMMFLKIPYDGLGGRAALPGNHQTKNCQPKTLQLNPVDHFRITRRARQQLKSVFKRSLDLSPDGRYGTRQSWLAAWDQLNDELKSGSRLSAWQYGLTCAIEGLIRLVAVRKIS